MGKHIRFQVSSFICAMFLFCLAPRVVLTQVTTGRRTGTVTDSSGAAVPRATVTITQTETAASTTVTTDGSGDYSATALKIGTYTVSAQKEGFQQIVQSNVTLAIGQVVRVDFVLKVGVVSERVDVNTAPPLLQAETSSLG